MPLPNTTQLVLLSCCCLVCPCERLNSLFSVYFGSMVLTHQAVVHRCKRLSVRGQGHRTPAPSFLKILPASFIFLLSGLPTHSFSASSPMELVSKHPGFQSGLLTMLNKMSSEPSLACLTPLRRQCREEGPPRSVTVSAPTALLYAGHLSCCWGLMVNLLSTPRSWNDEVPR